VSASEKIIDFLVRLHPVFKKPLEEIPNWKKLRNTIIILTAFALFSEVPLPYINQSVAYRLQTLQYIVGSSLGTLMSTGIGPVILGTLFVEIMYVAKTKAFRNLDLKSEEGRRKYMRYVMASTIFFLFAEGVVTAYRISIHTPTAILINSVLITIGGYIALLMVEYLKQYGLLSGISLFVMYRVSKSIFASLFNPLSTNAGMYLPAGKVAQLFYYIYGLATNKQDIVNMFTGYLGPMVIMPILGTIALWLIVNYLYKVKVTMRDIASSEKREYSLLMQTVMPIIFGVSIVMFLQYILITVNGFIHSTTLETVINYLSTPFGYLSWSDKVWWLVYTIVFAVPAIIVSYLFAVRLTDEKIFVEYYDYYGTIDYPGKTKFRKGFAKRYNIFLMRIRLINRLLPFYSAVIIVILALIGNALGVAAGGSGIILAVAIAEYIKKYLDNIAKNDKNPNYNDAWGLFKYTLKRMFTQSE